MKGSQLAAMNGGPKCRGIDPLVDDKRNPNDTRPCVQTWRQDANTKRSLPIIAVRADRQAKLPYYYGLHCTPTFNYFSGRRTD